MPPLNSRATCVALNEEGFVWPADERRSASRYNTIAVMCKHRRAGEVGLMINSKEMVFRYSPCFYSNPEDRAGWVSTGAWATFQSAPHAFLSPILRQKQRNIFEFCSKDQGCFTNTIKQCVRLDFALFPIKKHLLHNQTKMTVLTDSMRMGPGNCSQVLQSENRP